MRTESSAGARQEQNPRKGPAELLISRVYWGYTPLIRSPLIRSLPGTKYGSQLCEFAQGRAIKTLSQKLGGSALLQEQTHPPGGGVSGAGGWSVDRKNMTNIAAFVVFFVGFALLKQGKHGWGCKYMFLIICRVV